MLSLIALIIFSFRECGRRDLKKELRNCQELLVQEQPITPLAKEKVEVKAQVVQGKNADIKFAPLQKEYGKAKNINSFVSAELSSKGVLTDTVYVEVLSKDTIVRSFKIDDGYLFLECHDTNSVVTCPYQTFDSLEVVTVVKRFHLFKLKSWLKKNRGVFVYGSLAKGKILHLRAIIRED